jgi:DNA polymerase-3 subunit beta
MELDDQQLSLTTTDLELTTRVSMPVSGQAGQILLPARLLSDIVRNLPGEDVELVQDNGTMRVSGGRAKFALRYLAAEDFPRVQQAEDAKPLVLDGAAFGKALSQVAIAASRDETRPVLTGVLFEGEDDELHLVATDSYRLALRRTTVEGAGGIKILVPARVVQEVARMAGPGEIRVRAGGSQIAFETGGVCLQSRLIEGEFPAYRQLLPDSLPHTLEVDRGTFNESLRRVAVLAQDATPVFIELEEGAVRLTCQSQGLGEASEEIDASYSGEAMRVAFNATYLENGVDAVEGDTVRIELSEAQRPVLVRASREDPFVYLLMPIRVS